MKLLSWNIQWGRGADGEVNLPRTISAIRTLGDFDVICLQEVAVGFAGLQGGVATDSVARLAEAFPGYGAHFAPAVDLPDATGGRSQFGNLTLSRLPVGQVFRHSLPRPPEDGVPSMPRVCLEVVVEGPRGPVRVLNTHLEYYSRVQRMTQIAALHALQCDAVRLAASAPPVLDERKQDSPFAVWPRPVSAIVCGDFNCEPGSPEYYRMTAPISADVSGWEDAWRACYGDIPHLNTVGLNGAEWPDRPYCCDYFFVSADLVDRVDAVAVDQATAASDHQPIRLNLD
ncbi:endonuclease/exonuclease/phosphatase family protein [Zoogloea sp. 1C4]|uniref:endonuclease/exonuclease/phosphatase family protein n=1 Tax=Zoogloea sp. 1C4 TaxID=2570190 RepID=UPI00129134EA|nr:endonuclease/exonuclease/phosphatase family protein [Zoogloea sp. 1C4]